VKSHPRGERNLLEISKDIRFIALIVPGDKE
jgi:hypothetical protein